MKNKFILVLLIPVLYFIQSCDDPKKARNYNQQTNVDQGALIFINSAMDGGRTEIKLSAIAEHTSQDSRVLNFAKMMVNDHTQAIEQLKKLRKEELINPDDGLSVEHKKLIDHFSKLAAGGFDKAYMDQMVLDHEMALALFKDGSRDRSADVQSYAKKVLPTIQMHLDAARTLDRELK
ncbi:MAG: DUF4142 domain-containing protein [Mucilaginibacter sp.]